MTTPAERTRALIEAEKLLLSIIQDDRSDRETRDRVRACLRHYPTRAEIELMASQTTELAEPPKDPS